MTFTFTAAREYKSFSPLLATSDPIAKSFPCSGPVVSGFHAWKAHPSQLVLVGDIRALASISLRIISRSLHNRLCKGKCYRIDYSHIDTCRREASHQA